MKKYLVLEKIEHKVSDIKEPLSYIGMTRYENKDDGLYEFFSEGEIIYNDNLTMLGKGMFGFYAGMGKLKIIS